MPTSCTCHHMDFATYDEQHDYHKPLWEANPKQYGFLTPEDKELLQKSNDSQVLADNGRHDFSPPVQRGIVTDFTKSFDKQVGKYKVRVVQDGK